MGRELALYSRLVLVGKMKRIACSIVYLMSCAVRVWAQIQEPYSALHGGGYAVGGVSGSPDPLVAYHWRAPKATDSLQVYTLRAKKMVFTPARAFREEGQEIAVLGKGDLLLDFGVESAAWLEFDSDDLTDPVEASISEYNEPAIVNTGAQHRFKTGRPVKYGHTYRLELNDALYEGVRFAWIHVKSFSRLWHIKNIRLICQIRPTNYTGSFSCSDPALTRIWYTGAYTVKLNLLQDYFGAILMERSDRSSWTGDAYPAQAAALAAFGNYDMVKKNLIHTATEDNGIAAYSMYWVLSLIDYFDYTGDSAFLTSYTTNADKRLEAAYRSYDQLPPLHFMGWDERLGAGFENLENVEAQRAYRMLCINAWRRFAGIMAITGNTDLAGKYEQFADIKMKAALADSGMTGDIGVHAIAEAVNAGMGRYAVFEDAAKRLFADRLNRLSFSPFNQYFIIEAMASLGEISTALTTIRDCWGGQIDYGGTTFFEVYRPCWNLVLHQNDAPPNNQCGYTSLAHPWGAGVTQWLSNHILGIRPEGPGFKTFSMIPYLDKELTWVKGEMPTPWGTIHAGFDTRTGKGELTVPERTMAATVALPKAGKKVGGIIINGKGFAPFEQDERYVYLRKLKAGKYSIRLVYTGQGGLTEKPHSGTFNYPVKTTQAGGVAGKGFITHPLPDYIDTVTFHNEGWAASDSNGKVMITLDPAACMQTMYVDIKLKREWRYHLRLWFTDRDRQGRRSAVEIFDLHTLNMIAPVALIDHYEAGKYLSITCNRSIRIRIDQVRGKNAALGGIYFD